MIKVVTNDEFWIPFWGNEHDEYVEVAVDKLQNLGFVVTKIERILKVRSGTNTSHIHYEQIK